MVVRIEASENRSILYQALDDNGAGKDISAASAIYWVYVPKDRAALKVLLTGTYPFDSGDVTWYTDGTDGYFYVNIEYTDWASLRSGSASGQMEALVVVGGNPGVIGPTEMILGPDYFNS